MFPVVNNLAFGLTQNTANTDFIYFSNVYLWILYLYVSHTFEKYIFLFSYFEQTELSFTFLNKMWTEGVFFAFL